MAVRTILVLAFSIGCVATGTAHSRDFCDARYLARGATPPDAYARRAKDRYCDGVIAEPHGGQIDIVSATINSNHAGAAAISGSMRILRSSLPADLKSSEVHLRGVSLNSAVTYQFDAGVPGDDFAMDRESAMARLKLKPEDVGWVAQIPSFQGRRVIIPVVSQSNGPGDVIVTVRPALHSQGVGFHLLDGDKVLAKGSAVGVGGQNTLFEIKIPPGAPAMVGLKIWSTSTADDIEVDQVYLVRELAVTP